MQLILGAFSLGIDGRGLEADLSGQLQSVLRLRMNQIARACYCVLPN